MSYNPYGGKYTYGGSLMHHRTAIADGGSPNGYRKDGSQPIGQKRRGQVIGKRPDGTLIYSYGPQSAGQKSRNTQALQRAVSGGQQSRSRNTEALRQRVGTKAALDSRALNSNKGVVARREQKNRINVATASNAGARGVASREEAQRKGNRTIANQYGNTFGNRVGRAADAAGANIRGAATNTKKALKKAANEVKSGNIFQRGASSIGNWFNERRKDLGSAGRSVGNWLGERGRDIGKAAKSAYEALSNSDERRALEKAQQRVKANNSAKNRAALEKAKKDYDSHLLTRLGRGAKSVADTVGTTVRKAPGNLSKAASGAGEFISTTAKNAAGTVRRGAEAVGRAVSNQDELNAYKEALAREKANPTAENKRATREARDAYNKHALTKASGTVRQAGRNITRYASAKAEQARELLTSLPSSVTSNLRGLVEDIKSGKTKAEVDAAMIELQNNINMQVNGPASMPSDNYLDEIAPAKKKKK